MAAIGLVSAFMGWHELRDFERAHARAREVEQANALSHRLHEIEMQSAHLGRIVREFLITGDPDAPARYAQARRELARRLARLARDRLPAGLDVQAIAAHFARAHEKARRIFALDFPTGNMEGPILLAEMDREIVAVSQAISRAHHELDAAVDRAMRMTTALALDMRMDFVLALALLVALLVAFGWDLFRHVVRPLRLLRRKVRAFGRREGALAPPDFPIAEIRALAEALVRLGRAVREREQRLEEARSIAAHQEKMAALGLMAAGLAHEVGNPLAAARAALEVGLVKLDRGDAEGARSFLDDALNEIGRAEEVAREALAFGKPARDVPELLDPHPVVMRALKLVRLARRVPTLETEVRVENELRVHAPEDVLEQVLVNLLLNAVDAAGASGRVVVEIAAVDARWARLDVVDTGPGVPEPLRERIFSPFVSTKDKGTGLGLGISRTLVRRIGGDLLLVDGHPGRTRFRLLLPRENPATEDGDARARGG